MERERKRESILGYLHESRFDIIFAVPTAYTVSPSPLPLPGPRDVFSLVLDTLSIDISVKLRLELERKEERRGGGGGGGEGRVSQLRIITLNFVNIIRDEYVRPGRRKGKE